MLLGSGRAADCEGCGSGAGLAAGAGRVRGLRRTGLRLGSGFLTRLRRGSCLLHRGRSAFVTGLRFRPCLLYRRGSAFGLTVGCGVGGWPGGFPGPVSLQGLASEPDESRQCARRVQAASRVGFRLPAERLRRAGSEWAGFHAPVLLP